MSPRGVAALAVVTALSAPAQAQPAAVPQGQASPQPTVTPPSPTATEGGGSAEGWIYLGAGGAVVLTGVTLYLVGVERFPSACSMSTDRCPPGSSAETQAAVTNAVAVRDVGVFVGIVGGLILTRGLVYFLERALDHTATTSSKAQLAPSVSRGYGGLQLTGAF
jgi:hypothetical protein